MNASIIVPVNCAMVPRRVKRGRRWVEIEDYVYTCSLCGERLDFGGQIPHHELMTCLKTMAEGLKALKALADEQGQQIRDLRERADDRDDPGGLH